MALMPNINVIAKVLPSHWDQQSYRAVILTSATVQQRIRKRENIGFRQ